MRSHLYVFSALSVFVCSLFFAPQTHAQLCSENEFDVIEESGNYSLLRISNPKEHPLSLYGKRVEDSNQNEIELSGILFPGEEKIILLADDTNENEQTEPYQTATILLNEVFANPEGTESEHEFIELYNPNDFAVNLNGWSISDASKEYTMNGLFIEADALLILSREETGIALNNTNEEIFLIDPFEVLIDSFSYETTTEGLSWNRGNTWYEVASTPGSTNLSMPVETPPEEEQDTPPLIDEIDVEETIIEEPIEEEEIDPLLHQIILSELLPNPEGTDDQEWIELYNPTNSTILLSGLAVSDTTSEFFFEDGEIKSHGYFLLPRSISGIALNNSGDEITLSIHTETIDSMTYASSSEGYSWGIDNNGEWEEQQPTPEEENISHKEETISSPTIDVEEVDDDKAIATSLTSAKKNELVRMKGFVTVPNNLLKKKTVYLQTATGIVEVYSSKDLFPTHALGSLVDVVGKKSETTNGDRILLQEQTDFIVLENTTMSAHPLTNQQELALQELGSYVEISGPLIEQNQKDLIIDFDHNELLISLEHLAVQNLLPLREDLTILGIVWEKNAERIIIPFLPEHLQQKEENQSKDKETIQTQELPIEDHTYTEPLILGGSIAGIGSFLLREKIYATVKKLLLKY